MVLSDLSKNVRLTTAVVIALLAAGALQAETFVSYNGRFNFAYPDTWNQLDYTTAEFYLTRGNPDQEVEFEAIFCEKDALVLFRDQYLILTVDTVGSLSATQIDSVVNTMAKEFGRRVREVKPEEFLAGPDLNALTFDRAGGRIAVETEVAGDSTGTKINLLAMQIYEHGIANFYFYSPTSEYAANLPVYRDMVMSFSTAPQQAVTPSEPVKVADIKTEVQSTRSYWIIFGPALFVILLVLVVRLRKKRQTATGSTNQKD